MNAGAAEPRPVGGEADLVLAELESHARTTRDDRRAIKVALTAAVFFHVALLAVRLPADEVPPPPEKPTVARPYIVDIRLRPEQRRPPTPEVLEIPPDITIHVPVPELFSHGVEDLPATEVAVDELGELAVPPPAPTQAAPVAVGPIRPALLGVEPPVKLLDVEPVYPEMAHRAGVSGVVILDATIDRGGNVRNVRVLRPGLLGMTEAAIAAVRQWRYEPTHLNGRPTEVLLTVTVTFQVARP